MTDKSIGRRAALGAAAGAATLPLAAPLYAQGVRQMRMVTSWPADLAFLSGARLCVKQLLAQRVDVRRLRLALRLLDDNLLRLGLDLAREVVAGELELGDGLFVESHSQGPARSQRP